MKIPEPKPVRASGFGGFEDSGAEGGFRSTADSGAVP